MKCFAMFFAQKYTGDSNCSIQDNFYNIRRHDLLFIMSKWLNKVLVDVFLVDRMVLYTSQDSFFGINVAYVRKFL